MALQQQALIAGGGIGGLAAALACAQAGWLVRIYERATALAEVGAGIQLGPNAVRVLRGFGLDAALAAVAARPERLCVRDATHGALLGQLRLGRRALDRYGAPYLTLLRSDLHAALLDAAHRHDGVHFNLNSRVEAVSQNELAVQLMTSDGLTVEGDALIGADGLWSAVREHLLADGLPHETGHLAYRALLRQADLPQAQRCQDSVIAWLGPHMHAVQYPVRGGEWLNLVIVVQGSSAGLAADWDQAGPAEDLRAAMGAVCAPLRELVDQIELWRMWVLHERAPMSGPQQQAQGRVALLGDAAHPMRPYLAQGAGMAIEDAEELGRALALGELDVPLRLRRYALNRWRRNARVQRRSQRNGQIFHATGPLRWGRDLAMKLLGERLLDLPWLYGKNWP
ncbi:MAG: FAD-dependent monooxygenase [Burkholderiaceae bacterium]|nr:FAD-dependent monooxygenase [Burkholderiaceae bacterium]MDO9089812.1 FAD-dependent monooxygenase [Burkholderiaceae bacterium]